VDTITEARLVGLIDQALADAAKARPVRTDVVDVLLDLRMRVLALVVFDWIESGEGLTDDPRQKRPGFVGLMKRA
jgi:hypothetical protein